MSFKDYKASNYRIFLDMDGVLTNWNQQWDDLNTGYSNPDDMIKDKGYNEYNKVIDEGGLEFWSEMEWQEGGQELWKSLKDKDVTILSTPSQGKNNHMFSKNGKASWLESRLGVKGDIAYKPKEYDGSQPIILSPNKQLYIRTKDPSDSILIDGMPKNIKKWREKGGTGILHTSFDETVRALNQLGINT